jgi:hypothetical protein
MFAYRTGLALVLWNEPSSAQPTSPLAERG